MARRAITAMTFVAVLAVVAVILRAVGGDGDGHEANGRRVTAADRQVTEPVPTPWLVSALPEGMSRPESVVETRLGVFAWVYRDADDDHCWWRFDAGTMQWQPAPEPPISYCVGASHGAHVQAVATGDGIMLWGAAANDTFLEPVQAAMFDPNTDEWSDVPPGPLVPRQDFRIVWTGEEVLVWGGSTTVPGKGDGGRPSVDVTDGAAFDPRTRQWRALEPSPLGRGHVAAAGWTGDEWVLWSGGDDRADGAAYDPLRRTWRTIAAAPIAGRMVASSAVVGGELIIWSGQPTIGAVLGDGAVYDAAGDTWRVLPEAPIAPRVMAGVASVHGRLAVWSGTANEPGGSAWFDDGATFDPTAGQWTRLPARRPSDEGPMFPIAIALEGRLLVVGPDRSTRVLRDPWTQMPPTSTPRSHPTSSLPPCPVSLRSATPPVGWDPVPRAGAGNEEPEDPSAIAHFVGPERGRTLTIHRPDTGRFDAGRLLAEGRELAILDGHGAIAGIHEGFGAAWSSVAGDCALAFVGYGIAKSEMVALLEGLYEVDDSGLPRAHPRGSLWPHGGADAPAAWREDATETARRFAVEVLGWKDAVAEPGEPSEDGRDGVVMDVRRASASNESRVVWVARALGRRWHAVYGVRTVAPTHCGLVSVDVAGRLWIADPPQHDDSGNPPPGFDENATTGIVRATAPGRTEFVPDFDRTAAFRLRVPGNGEKDPDHRCE